LLYRRDPGEIATAILALLDTRQGSIIYANAGTRRRSPQDLTGRCCSSIPSLICRSESLRISRRPSTRSACQRQHCWCSTPTA
jgi:hypothetical protein